MSDGKGNGKNGGNGDCKVVPLFGTKGHEIEDPEFESTGELPEGQLNEDGKGALQFGISHDPQKGVVILAFGEPVSWLGFPPQRAEQVAGILRDHAFALTDEKFHRDARPLPTDPAERKAAVLALKSHPLWHYPVTHRVPPDGESYFGEPEGDGDIKLVPMKFDGPDWHDEVHRDGGGFEECVDIETAYVNPVTERIEDDDALYIAFRVWIEAGGWFDNSTDENMPVPKEGWNDYNKWGGCHDFRLNCGASDLETALLMLARLVDFYYHKDGSDIEDAPKPCEGYFENDDEDRYVDTCEDAGDGYCRVCGFLMEPEEDDDGIAG